MIETHGLNHISLAVRDPDVSLAFYTKLFGVREYVHVYVEDPDGYEIEIWYE